MAEDKNVTQLPLFADFPEDPILVERAREFLHTGKIVLKDRERCEQIVEAVLLGDSSRAIARRFRVGRHTIKQIVCEAERMGKLAPMKERLAGMCIRVAGMALQNSEEMLEDGKVPANVLPIMTGVAIEKLQLLTGLATVIVEQKGGTAADPDRWLTEFRAVRDAAMNRPSIDVQSIVESAESPANAGGSCLPVPVPAPVDLVEDGDAGAVEGGGGGRGFGGAGADGIGSVVENIECMNGGVS